MPRSILLAATLATTLALPAVQAAQAAPHTSATSSQRPRAQQPGHRPAAPTANPFDQVQRLARTPKFDPAPAPAPRSLVESGRIPGPQTKPVGAPHRPRPAAAPCTLDGITGLSPEQLADFLADPAVTADDCLRNLVWTWDPRLIPVMSDAHVQAVARRITGLAAAHDSKNTSHLYEMFTYLHAVAYQDFSHDEIDTTDAPTVAAVRGAVEAFGTAARTFDVTRANADTLREALYAASAPGLRQHQLDLIQKVLATMDPSHSATYKDPAWANAALAGLSVNYLGVYPGNKDTAFQYAVATDPGYRAVFKAFAGYTHLKGTPNAWVVRDALGEYGRFGQIDSLKKAIVTDLGALLPLTVRNFGDGSEPWAKVATWLISFDACKPYGVCKEDIEKRIFPRTYSYDNGAIKVRTALDRAVVDQLYYASKQVRAQFHRVLGTTEPLAGDPNTTLTIVLYASRAGYEVYHPLLTGMGTNNGGVYIEQGATFYTYQRRVPQDSSLTLEELFRHEYVHYLNGRFAVPGFFGEGPWYEGDRTTAMDEGSAEFFDGSTRDNGIAVRQSLVRDIITDTTGGKPRMSVNEFLHATYDHDGFRFYSYAGTFFEFLWREHPAKLQEMYRYLRADDPAAFDSWRNRMGSDAGLQQQYDAFLDAQIALVDDLFVPNTTFTPNGSLKFATPAEVQSAFAAATSNTPVCKDEGDRGNGRFTCNGRITANLGNSGNPDQIFKDMSETVDYFILDRAGPTANNFTDMNCSFGPTDVWPSGREGSADFRCEGPLRR
ncbi:collagenase [Streptomyces sp. NPDC048434]|uniref:collagenase n=1 Tax=Streptomyces sp. NPDC048434 TaxID=3365549 RepID=UPI003715B80D